MTLLFYRKQRTASHDSGAPKRLANTDVITTWACTLTSLVAEQVPLPLNARNNQKIR